MLEVALLGAGRIGRVHASNVVGRPDMSLRYVCDPVVLSATDLAAWTGASIAAEDAALSDPDVGAVIIASSAEAHAGQIRKAAAAGKAIFCEKPISRDAAEVAGCLNFVESTGAFLFMAFNRRFDPSFAALKRRLEAGEVGRPELVVLTSRDPYPPPIDYIAKSGGLFRETTIHDFDVARWLLPEEPVEVFAAGSCLVDPAIAGAGSPDTIVATLRTAGGALCVVNNSWRAAYGYDQRAEVLGSGGMLSLDNLRPTSVSRWEVGGTSHDAAPHFFMERYAEAYRLELDAFALQLAAGKGSSPNGADGLQALVIADCAALSLAQNRPVRIPAPRIPGR